MFFPKQILLGNLKHNFHCNFGILLSSKGRVAFFLRRNSILFEED